MKELDFEHIGNRIREIRIEKGLTQEYLANSADVNVSHISNIENNRVKISLTLLVNLSNALGCTIDYLLENEYGFPSGSVEKEILSVLSDLEDDKKETLLRIARVL